MGLCFSYLRHEGQPSCFAQLTSAAPTDLQYQLAEPPILGTLSPDPATRAGPYSPCKIKLAKAYDLGDGVRLFCNIFLATNGEGKVCVRL